MLHPVESIVATLSAAAGASPTQQGSQQSGIKAHLVHYAQQL
jgi:hypothetical protein